MTGTSRAFRRVKELLAESTSISFLNQPDADGYYPLQWAALNNRDALMEFLLENGARIDNKDTKVGQPGWHASSAGAVPRTLWSAASVPSALAWSSPQTGQSAFHWAAVTGADRAVDVLMRAGADPLDADCKGYTPLHIAAQYGQTAMVYALATRYKAPVDVTDGDGRSALHWAAYKGNEDICKLLLVMDAKVNRTDSELCTPLHWAAIRGYAGCLTTLVHGGGGDALSMPEVNGQTPEDLARDKGHAMVVGHLRMFKEQVRGWGTVAAGVEGRESVSVVLVSFLGASPRGKRLTERVCRLLSTFVSPFPFLRRSRSGNTGCGASTGSWRGWRGWTCRGSSGRSTWS